MLGGGICRPRVNGLARGDERGVCFVVVPIKYSVGVRHALIAPQSYDVRVHVYTYSKNASCTLSKYNKKTNSHTLITIAYSETTVKCTYSSKV